MAVLPGAAARSEDALRGLYQAPRVDTCKRQPVNQWRFLSAVGRARQRLRVDGLTVGSVIRGWQVPCPDGLEVGTLVAAGDDARELVAADPDAVAAQQPADAVSGDALAIAPLGPGALLIAGQ